jgi:hypothetical protein
MSERRTIEIHIVMDESGAFVVADDANVAAEQAEEVLGEDADVRQVALIIEMLPPSASPEPIMRRCQID